MTSLRILKLVLFLILVYVFYVVGDEVNGNKDTVKNGATSVPDTTGHSKPPNSSSIPVPPPPPPPPPLSQSKAPTVPKKGKSTAHDISAAAMMRELANKVQARRSSRSREREKEQRAKRQKAPVGKVIIPTELTQPRISGQATESTLSEDKVIPEPPGVIPEPPGPIPKALPPVRSGPKIDFAALAAGRKALKAKAPEAENKDEEKENRDGENTTKNQLEKKGPPKNNILSDDAQANLVAELKTNGKGKLKPKPNSVAPTPPKEEPAKALRAGLKSGKKIDPDEKSSATGSRTPVNSGPQIGPQLLKQSKSRNSDPKIEAGTVPALVPEPIAKRQNLRSAARVENSQPQTVTTGEVPGKHTLKSAATREQQRPAVEAEKSEQAALNPEKPGPQNLKPRRPAPSTAKPAAEETAVPQFPTLKKAEPKSSGPAQSQQPANDIGPHRLRKPTTVNPDKTADIARESSANIDPRSLPKAPRRIPEKKIPDETAVKTNEGAKEVLGPGRLRKPTVNPGETVAAKSDGVTPKIDPRDLPKAPRRIPEKKAADSPAKEKEAAREILGPERLRKRTEIPDDSTTSKGDESLKNTGTFDPGSLPKIKSKRPPTTATESAVTPFSDARPGPQNLKPRRETAASQPVNVDGGPKIPGQSSLRKTKREITDTEPQIPEVNRNFRENLRKAKHNVPEASIDKASPAQETLERFKQRSMDGNSQTSDDVPQNK